MDTTTSIIEPTLEHAHAIALRARPGDIEELKAYGKTPFDAMEYGIRESTQAFTGLYNGEPVLMAGITRACLIPNMGVPWMITSDLLDQRDIAVRFLRLCRNPLMDFFREYDILMNYVHTRNVKAIRWLQYMGFTVKRKPEPYGMFNMPFHKFMMVRSQAPCVPRF